MMVNGVALSSGIAGGWGGGAVPNASGTAEFAIDVSGRRRTGGDRRRARELHSARRRQPLQRHHRGQLFQGQLRLEQLHTGTDVQQRGLTAPSTIKGNGEFNPGVGGPLKRDKVWFFLSGKDVYADNYVAGMFFNANAQQAQRVPLREIDGSGDPAPGPADLPDALHVSDEPEEQVRRDVRPGGILWVPQWRVGDCVA